MQMHIVGYNPIHKGYRCYDPVIKHLRIAKHVSFLENLPYYSSAAPPQNVSFLQPPVSLPIPAYAPPAPPTPPPDTSVPSAVPTDVQDTSTMEPCSNTDALSTPGDPSPSPPPRRNPHRDRHLPAQYAKSSYSPLFSAFVATIHSI